ncbi:hypothetical protein ID866_2210 [Astraeus odoratus]|nr:hypothetical protein ID866_2210 [Astraeus odoratus]
MAEDRLFTAVHPFNRDNLFYEVRYSSAPDPFSQMSDIVDVITSLYRRRNQPSSGIIYCRLRGMCDELSKFLRGKGLNAKSYHRGIKSSELEKTLREWEIGGMGEGGVDVVCATIAFGMGIDKSDVRYIIHYDLPKSFEGRAGRDGLPSRCILYYSREDAFRLRGLVSSTHAKRQDAARAISGPEPSQRSVDSLQALIDFAENVDNCRHVSICRYFGETIDPLDVELMKSVCNKMCDVCEWPDKARLRKQNLTEIESFTWTEGGFDDEDGDDFADNCAPAYDSFQTGRGLEMSRALSNSIGKLAAPTGFQSAKRACGEDTGLPNSKRTKHEKEIPPAALVTKPYVSASSLRKPFKVPFKTPFKANAEPPCPQQSDRQDSAGDHGPLDGNGLMNSKATDADSDEVEIVEIFDEHQKLPTQDEELCEVDKQPTDERSIQLPDITIELEASFSQKIPVTVRMKSFGSLRETLHRVVGSWDSDSAFGFMKDMPTDGEARALVLADAAKTIEFSVQTMSATQSGYDDRVNRKLHAIQQLETLGAWATGMADDCEDEDTADAVQAVKGALESWKASR